MRSDARSLPRSRSRLRMPVVVAAAAVGALLAFAQPAAAGETCPFTFVANAERAGAPAGIQETYFASAGDVLKVVWGPSSWTTAAITGDLTAGPVNYPGPLTLTFPSTGAFDLTIAFTGPDSSIQRTVSCTHTQSVPTLGAYGLALLALSLLAVGGMAWRRR